MQSIELQMVARIRRRRRGAVFTPGDFVDLGSRSAVDLALHRLTARGTLTRLARGLYSYPETHPRLGELMPSVDEIAKALGERGGVRLQPAGAYAANLLHLTEQVPARIEFLTDGRRRTVRIGNLTFELRPATPRAMAAAGRLSGLLMAALRHLGKQHVTNERLAALRASLPPDERRRLLRDMRLAPAWMHPHFRYLAGEADDEA